MKKGKNKKTISAIIAVLNAISAIIWLILGLNGDVQPSVSFFVAGGSALVAILEIITIAIPDKKKRKK